MRSNGAVDDGHDDGLGQLLALLATGQASSRAELVRLSGMSASTVSHRVDLLLSLGLVVESGEGRSTGGRRPVLLAVNPEAGLVLAADIGASHYEIAIADLGQQVLARVSGAIDLADGPDAVLSELVAEFQRMLDELGRSAEEVRAIGVGLPAPVEFASGTVVRPPIKMTGWLIPGWAGFNVPDWFRSHFQAPVLVDNDVNVMALGVYGDPATSAEQLLVVKVATGIGCGIISRGQLHRGADGAAGDIGHIRVAGKEDVTCRCGNSGCLEAVASGAAIARQLQAEGVNAQNTRDVVQLAHTGDARALRAVREAGQHIGEVLASLVNFYNPHTIVIGGALAELRDELLAAIRGVIYQRALPLATRKLDVMALPPGQHAAVIGAVMLARQEALSPSAIASRLGDRTRSR